MGDRKERSQLRNLMSRQGYISRAVAGGLRLPPVVPVLRIGGVIGSMGPLRQGVDGPPHEQVHARDHQHGDERCYP